MTLSYMENFNNLSEDLTTMWCDTKRLTKLHFPSQYQRLNNTATSPPTTIKFLLKRETRRMKTSTTMAKHDPRMNRTNPKYHALLGIVGTWSTSCDFCNCLLLPCVFLIVFAVVLCVSWMCVVPCAHVWLGLSALQTPLACKKPNRKTSLKCVSLSSIYVSSSSIDKLKLER
jgi:hypothetical protein